MGVEPYLVAASVRGVLAQRLVRRLCQKCKREVEPSHGIQQLLAEAFGGTSPLETAFEGKGCAACRKTGFRGRTGIHEMLLADEEMFASAGNDLSLPAIRRAAEARGMMTMLHDCVEKVRAGVVSAEALYEVLGAAGEPDQPATPDRQAA
jgi:type II secretory ATPase GspE/PulE/Tfp pilus assembly ATPase PilB-like protein